MRRFRRCLRAFARHKGELFAGAGCLVVASALDVGIPLLVARGLNRLEAAVRAAEPAAVSRDFLLFTVGAIVLGSALKGIFRYGQRYLLIGVSRKVEADLKRDLFAHLTSLSPRFFAASRTGDLLSRATGDLEAVRLFLGPGSMYAASTLLLVPAALAAMVHFYPLLTGLVLLPLGALAFSMKAIMPTLNRRSESVQAALAEISERAQENFSGVRVVKGLAREDWETARFASSSDLYRRHQLGLGKARALNHTLLYASKDVAFLLILGVGGLGLLRGSFPVGGIYLFLDYVNRLFWPLIALGWMAGMYHRAAAGMDRVEEIFAIRPEVEDPSEPAAIDSIRGGVEFRDLSFAYDGEPALKGIRLRAEPGQVIGIAGRIGSGKTTLVSLLGRLFPVPDGTVFLDGTDLNRIPLRRLRESIGFVPQDSFLFSETIRENLAFGFDDLPPREAVARAAEAAALGPDLASLPEGLDTLLGERGVTLSGGQRQRVAIGRALLKDPRILVLDDALSAVDTETEAAILERLRRGARGRTVFLVAQRLSAVEFADRIVVLDAGRIVEEGTHAELLLKEGWYARTWRRQRVEGELESLR